MERTRIANLSKFLLGENKELQRVYLITLGVYALHRILWVMLFPPLLAPDSQKYVRIAQAILAGQQSVGVDIHYLLLPLLLAPFLAGNIPLYWVVMGNHVLGFFTVLFLLKAFAPYVNKRVLLISGILLVVHPEIILLENYVLTEALALFFLSIVVFGISRILRENPPPLSLLLSLGVVLVLITFTRRTCSLLFVPVFLFLLYRLGYQLKQFRLLGYTILTFLLVFLVLGGVSRHFLRPVPHLSAERNLSPYYADAFSFLDQPEENMEGKLFSYLGSQFREKPKRIFLLPLHLGKRAFRAYVKDTWIVFYHPQLKEKFTSGWLVNLDGKSYEKWVQRLGVYSIPTKKLIQQRKVLGLFHKMFLVLPAKLGVLFQYLSFLGFGLLLFRSPRSERTFWWFGGVVILYFLAIRTFTLQPIASTRHNLLLYPFSLVTGVYGLVYVLDRLKSKLAQIMICKGMVNS